jgi:hypothetical protein
MPEDPIVEEIHATRDKIAAECQYDLKQIIKRIKKNEQKNKNRLVQGGVPKHTKTVEE